MDDFNLEDAMADIERIIKDKAGDIGEEQPDFMNDNESYRRFIKWAIENKDAVYDLISRDINLIDKIMMMTIKELNLAPDLIAPRFAMLISSLITKSIALSLYDKNNREF